MNKLKDKKLFLVLGILGLVLITTGITYAFFRYTKEGSTENTLKSGSITFLYDEINQSGNSIGIENALPISDTDGKAQSDYFNFKIVSTSASTIAIPYEVTLRQKSGTDDIGDIIKVYLSKTTSYDASVVSEEEVELSLYSNLSNVTKNSYTEKLLHTDIVPATDSRYEQYYRLKMWVDNSVDFKKTNKYYCGTTEITEENYNDTEYVCETGEKNIQQVYPYNNKTFTVMVNVYAEGHVTSDNTTVNSVSVAGTELTKTQVSGIDTYNISLPVGTTSTNVAVETEDEYATVTVTKTASDYSTPVADNGSIQRLSLVQNKTINVTAGENYFKIVVTSENNKNTKEIHLKISVEDPTLRGRILKNNPTVYTNPTLTKTSTSANEKGLYSMTVTNGFGGQSATGTTYYFRGNVTNNYVKFAGKTWRIIRINEDGTVRLILDDRIDTKTYEFNNDCNKYTAMYYSVASGIGNKNYPNAKYTLNNWYQTNIGNNSNYASKIANGSYFCESAKTYYSVNGGQYYYSVGKVTMTKDSDYIPDLKCETDGNGHGLLNSTYKIGLITIDEVLSAGGRPSINNKSYYLYKTYGSWTMSPAGRDKLNGNPAYIWTTPTILGNSACMYFYLRPVINLKADTLATGSGTSGNPYVVQ